MESCLACLSVDAQGNGGIKVVDLLGASHHQTILSELQCQPLGSILGVRYGQPTCPSIGKPCPHGPSTCGCGFSASTKTMKKEKPNEFLKEFKPSPAAAAPVGFLARERQPHITASEM